MLKWEIIHEMDLEDGTPTGWGAQINSDKEGRFAWISETLEGFEITTSNHDDAIVVCKTLTSAKRYTATYLI